MNSTETKLNVPALIATLDALQTKVEVAVFHDMSYRFPTFKADLNDIKETLRPGSDLGKRKVEVIDLTNSPTETNSPKPSPRDKVKGPMRSPFGLGMVKGLMWKSEASGKELESQDESQESQDESQESQDES